MPSTCFTVSMLFLTQSGSLGKEKHNLGDVLMVAGISKEYFSEFIEELYKKGLTRKLMEEHTYLIVLDEEELQSHLVERLKDIEEKLLTAVGE